MMSRKQEALLASGLGILLACMLHGPLLAALGGSLPGEAASDVFRAHWTAWLMAATGTINILEFYHRC